MRDVLQARYGCGNDDGKGKGNDDGNGKGNGSRLRAPPSPVSRPRRLE